MNPPANRLMLAMLLVILQVGSFAQEHAPYAAWLFPGVSWHPAKNVRLLGELGYNNYFRMALAYPQAFVTVHKNIILNPAYIYTLQKKEGTFKLQEHYLMNAIILQAAKKSWLIDDRNMLWNRLPVGSKATHYYRNRLRITQSFKIASVQTRVYGFNEIFYSFNNKNLSRNRAAFGISCDFITHINVDITYIRQWDRFAGDLNLFFIAGIWQW